MTDSFDFEKIGFDFSELETFQAVEEKRKTTSDTLAHEAKIFLESALIATEAIKPTTCKIINNVIDDLSLPERGHQTRIRTQQQFNMIAIVTHMAMIHECIDELTIATYTLNKEAFDIIVSFVKSGVINKLNLMLASSYSFRNKERYALMKSSFLELTENHDVHLVFAWCHFKITLAKCGDDFYQIEGSMNYSQNNMAEQILITNDRELYDYDHSFILDTMANRENKALEVVV